MSQFHAILIEGLFYEKEGSRYIEQENGEHVAWDALMEPVVDQRVQIALHHLPPHGIDLGKPGAGSCRYPAGVGCPVGHDLYPDRLLSFSKEGVLRNDPWRIELFDTTWVLIPLGGMIGHFGRVGAATVFDVEKMRASLASMNPEAMMAALASSGVSAEELEVMLGRLRKENTP